jgi:DNA-binding GntR family transcriptional regulator
MNNIINGNLEEGERLVEQNLARLFGVSRQPIHEALQKLEMEGFVEFIPYKGFTVSHITPKDAEETLELKGLLEGYAAWKCAHFFNEKITMELETILFQMETHIEQGCQLEILNDNFQFHHRIMENIKNEKMYKFYQTVINSLKRYYAIGLATITGPQTSLLEHQKILDKIRIKDAIGAQEVARQHAFNTIDRVKKALSERKKKNKIF